MIQISHHYDFGIKLLLSVLYERINGDLVQSSIRQGRCGTKINQRHLRVNKMFYTRVKCLFHIASSYRPEKFNKIKQRLSKTIVRTPLRKTIAAK